MRRQMVSLSDADEFRCRHSFDFATAGQLRRTYYDAFSLLLRLLSFIWLRQAVAMPYASSFAFAV